MGWLLSLGGFLFKLLGVTALEEAMAHLKAQFDETDRRLAVVEAKLAAVEKNNAAVVHGWELMHKAREQLPHAGAADPRLPGESLSDAARRVGRHVPQKKVANVEGEGDEPPDSHV